jgi:hypothetical protein
MGPFTISNQLIRAIERYADPNISDEILLEKVRAECPTASLREISRAALYATTDPFLANEAIIIRLFRFATTVRRMA